VPPPTIIAPPPAKSLSWLWAVLLVVLGVIAGVAADRLLR